ncbi:MAG: DoxX family protein [Spirosomataceae bacterium]
MTTPKKSNLLHIVLWVIQVLLAVAFGMAGFMKTTAPIEQLSEMGMKFVNHTSVELVRFIGVSEILGAIGLILPSALRIKPILTPIAAIGIATIMVLAVREHLTQNEPIIANVVMFALAAFVAWGRLKKAPISPK